MSSRKKTSWGKRWPGAKKQRIGSWADWAARRPWAIESPPERSSRLTFRPGPSLGGSGSPSPAAKAARCSACPHGGCPNCPTRRR